MNLINLLVVFAAKLTKPDTLPKVEADEASNGVIALVYWGAGIVAVIVLIIAGIMYTSSNGDPGKAKTARNMILYTVTGLIFIILATSIVAFVSGKVG